MRSGRASEVQPRPERSQSLALTSKSARERKEAILNNPEMLRTKQSILEQKMASNNELLGALQLQLQQLKGFSQRNKRLVDQSLQTKQSRKMRMKVNPSLFASQGVKFLAKEVIRELTNSYTIWALENEVWFRKQQENAQVVKSLVEQIKAREQVLFQNRGKQQTSVEQSRIQNTHQKLALQQLQSMTQSLVKELQQCDSDLRLRSDEVTGAKTQLQQMAEEKRMFASELQELQSQLERENQMRVRLQIAKKSNDVLGGQLERVGRMASPGRSSSRLASPGRRPSLDKRSKSRQQASGSTLSSRRESLSQQLYLTPTKIRF